MKKKMKKSRVLGVVALGAFAIAMVVAILAMSHMMSEIKEEVVSHTPDAILASAGLKEGESVSLPVVYYDQREDACPAAFEEAGRQFGWSECGYFNKDLEQGMVEYELGEDHLPVVIGGKLVTNKGVTKESTVKWFKEVEGESKSYNGVIKLEYVKEGAEFSFYKDEFYPLDSLDKGAGEKVNHDGHNHLFTMSFAVPFTVITSGEEGFEIVADDDTWVYVGDKLVLDMGGIHEAMAGSFAINEGGEVYAGVNGQSLAYTGVNLTSGEGALIRIFHADRDADDSKFDLRITGMNLSVMESQFARKGENESVQIAYDPTDPNYMPPLGATSVVRPDETKKFIVIATVEGMLVVVFVILVMVSIRYLLRKKA